MLIKGKWIFYRFITVYIKYIGSNGIQWDKGENKSETS